MLLGVGKKNLVRDARAYTGDLGMSTQGTVTLDRQKDSRATMSTMSFWAKRNVH